MSALNVKGIWSIALGKLKEKSARLINEDVKFTEGKREEFIDRIQTVTGETREQVRENCFNSYTRAF